MFQHLAGLFRGKTPGQLIIQLTDRCNARCPQCSMRVTNSFQRSTLELSRGKEIIDKAAEQGIRALSVAGGEPLPYPREVAAIIKDGASKYILYTRTGTNGFIFRAPGSPDFSNQMKRTA